MGEKWLRECRGNHREAEETRRQMYKYGRGGVIEMEGIGRH